MTILVTGSSGHLGEALMRTRRLGWRLFPGIDRVYVNERACRELGWRPRFDFRRAIELLQIGEEPRSPLARAIGMKGYHAELFEDAPYPVD